MNIQPIKKEEREFSDDEAVRILEMRENNSSFEEIASEVGNATAQDVEQFCVECDDEVEIPMPAAEMAKYQNRMAPKRASRTTMGLCDRLFDAMDDLMSGRISSYDAMSMAKLSDSICRVVQTEVSVDQLRRNDVIEHAPTNLQLGERGDEGN